MDDGQGPGALAFCGTGIEPGTCLALVLRCNAEQSLDLLPPGLQSGGVLDKLLLLCASLLEVAPRSRRILDGLRRTSSEARVVSYAVGNVRTTPS